MATEVEKPVAEEEKPSELTMDAEVLRKTCNYALIKVRATRLLRPGLRSPPCAAVASEL